RVHRDVDGDQAAHGDGERQRQKHGSLLSCAYTRGGSRIEPGHMSRKHTQTERAAGCFDELLAAARRTTNRLRARTLEKGECLLRQGDPLPGLFLISSG